MMNFRICDYAHPLRDDIERKNDPGPDASDQSVNTCVLRSTEALKRKVPDLTEMDRVNLASIFDGMRSTHKSIRILLDSMGPTAVDSFTLARSQLESLFAICLIVENPQSVKDYIRDGWRKQYKLFLLQREEHKNLPSHQIQLQQQGGAVDDLRSICDVSDQERQAIENYELGQGKELKMRFPSPMQIIEKVSGSRRRMLIRLYADYGYLSSWVHALPPAMALRTILADKNSLSTSDEDSLSEITAQSESWSLLSVVQAASELTCLYPDDIKLRARLTGAWNLLTKYTYLGKVIWEIRTKDLLGSV